MNVSLSPELKSCETFTRLKGEDTWDQFYVYSSTSLPPTIYVWDGLHISCWSEVYMLCYGLLDI